MKRTAPFVLCTAIEGGVPPSGIKAMRAHSFNAWLSRGNYPHGACTNRHLGEPVMAEVVLVAEGSPEFDQLLAYVFGQLAQTYVVVVGGDSTATLHWCDGRRSPAGRWKSAGPHAPDGDCTYRAGQYYVIEESPHA